MSQGWSTDPQLVIAKGLATNSQALAIAAGNPTGVTATVAIHSPDLTAGISLYWRLVANGSE